MLSPGFSESLVALALASLILFSPATVNAGDSSGFFWGVASSGFQVEGSNPDSNWKRYVDANAASGQLDPVNNATDFWNRYEEDIANAAAMGVNTFRVSVEWARIEPRQGQWDYAALARYDSIIRCIRRHGMRPLITMLHFVYPGWLQDQGGFLADAAPHDFARFAELITQRWGGQGTLWLTINEPLQFFLHELRMGLVKVSDQGTFFDHLVSAHRLAYDAAHDADPNAQVTVNELTLPIIPEISAVPMLDRVQDKVDFVSLDYYYDGSLNNLSSLYAGSGQIYRVIPQPVGLYGTIKYYSDRYAKPLFVMENGMATDNGVRTDGIRRGDFIRDSVFWIQRAVADGYPVIGYTHWALTDNYEWGDYRPRFGLYRVDVLSDPTLTRKPTSGVAAYRHIIANGGVDDDYRPALPDSWCDLANPPDSCLHPPSPDGPLARLL